MKRIMSVVLLVSLVFTAIFTVPANAEPQNTGITVADTKMYTNAGTTNEHTLPGETTEYIMDVPVNSTFQVLDSKFDGDGDKWYLVDYNGITGYLLCQKVRLTATRYFDSDFEKNLSNFSAEYHEALINLHNEYPNWRFIAEPTGCTLSEALENEYRSGDNKRPRKYVELTYMGEEWRDERAKLPVVIPEDNPDAIPEITYENAEGNRWTYASAMAISYFMNPINFLNSNDIFMFLQLSDNDGNHTRDMLATVVENTFLNNDTYLDAIMQAAAETKLSPLVIASLIIIEQGIEGTSSLISGAYPGYEGFYNFFNVGASGQTPEEIIASGLNYAQAQGWNSIVASIIGGANFCKNGYISCGQDTYYYMDYNVIAKDYNHQYATAIYDAYNKGRKLADSCKSNKNAAYDFVIPVFTPEAASNTQENGNGDTAVEEPPVVIIINYGDINKDNVIDVIDAAIIRKHILGVAPLDVSANPEADINQDGVIDVIDAAKIRKDILNIEKIGGQQQ